MWTVLLFVAVVVALSLATGSEQRTDALGRDTVTRLFRDPHRRDDR